MRAAPDTDWQHWELPALAARRLHRRVAGWAWRPRLRAPGAVLAPVPAGDFCHAGMRVEVVRRLAGLPGAVEEVEARAAAAAEGRFRVFGQEVALRSPLDRRRDPLSGDTRPDAPARQVAAVGEGRDPRYVWALGRLDGLVALGQGAWLAEPGLRSRRVRALEALQQDFLAHNPPGTACSGPAPWRWR
ncbi:MAG: hypothetical protein FJ086_10185 [Deltaproteobacteria bacterium]|nr:hypothetical protein [Deltaproteobacteria bacterium]